MYSAKILADSVSHMGVRLTTVEATFPRFILAEVNTHRVLSRNSASSRAIPTEKIIERVETNPFVPIFNQRVKGMGVGEVLNVEAHREATRQWLKARDDAVRAAKAMLHIDKSRVNRLLEPFMWHTAIISATEWSNFLALRTAETAQPEFRRIAQDIERVRKASLPRALGEYDWHLPLLSAEEIDLATHGDHAASVYWRKVSVGRCARVSYLTHDGRRDPEEDVALAQRLLENRHLSPFEHVATPCRLARDQANFRGWAQLRAFVEDEDDYGRHLQKAAA